MKKILYIFSLFIICVSESFPQSPDSVSATSKSSWYNRLRYDSEYRFAVPPEKEDMVWNYLISRYRNTNDFLKQIDSAYYTKFAQEKFMDAYYDTRELKILQLKSGVRYRRRFFEKDAGKMVPDKELVQIKFNAADPLDSLVRGEYKFPVKEKKKKKSKDEKETVSDHEKKQREPQKFVYLMVPKKNRKEFLEKASLLKVDPKKLRHKLDLEQVRKRVYILKSDTTFITITLDLVNTVKWGVKAHFAEVEFEINEKVFTVSDTSARNRLWGVLNALEGDLLNKFPDLVQDQTPKYNKMVIQFEKKIPGFLFWLKNGNRMMIILLFIVLLGVGAFVRKRILKNLERTLRFSQGDK